MKKLFLVLCLSVYVKVLCGQSDLNLDNLICYKLNISPINNYNVADYAARLLEKNNTAIFAAFDTIGNGYIIIEKDFYLHECKKYLENCSYNFRVNSIQKVELNDEEFLKIYQIRGKKKINEKPEFIQLGPKNELSNALYKIAKDTWIKLYPEEYKQLQTPQQITPEDLKLMEMKNQIKNQ
ncbi:MAG: hypothetical protein N3A01_08365 [Bacteroidales bacterium]|nr:hypothetical protein [Bacteroidales bacterium]